MNIDGKWATEVEVFAMATALSAAIVYYALDQKDWLFYNPISKSVDGFVPQETSVSLVFTSLTQIQMILILFNQ